MRTRFFLALFLLLSPWLKAKAEVATEVSAWHQARIRLKAAQGWLAWEAVPKSAARSGQERGLSWLRQLDRCSGSDRSNQLPLMT